MRVHLVNPSHVSFGVGSHHAALALRARRRYTRPVSAPRTSLTRPSRSSTRRPCNRVTSWASAYTPATRCAATKSAAWSASGARPSSSAASTPRSTRRSRPSWAGPTRSSRATATWPGGRRSTTSPPAPCSRVYEGGRVDAEQFKAARWDLLPDGSYMWASVQTIRGCPKHCSFCSVWRTDGQQPRQRHVDVVVDEIVELRRKGYPLHRPRRRQLLSGRRRKTCAWRGAAPTRPGCTSSRPSAPSASS